LTLPDQATPNGVQVVVYRATDGGFEILGETRFDVGADVPE
jgi:hypothetical protein